MIPLLVRPSILAIKNRISYAEHPWKEASRTLVVLILGIAISIFSLFVTTETLQALVEISQEYYVSPLRLLELILLFLFLFSIITSSISFLSIFFLADDLEFLRTTPIKFSQFIIGRFAQLTATSCWVLVFFGIPVLIGYGAYYDHPAKFYIATLVLLPLLLLLSTSIGAMIVMLISFFIPANRAREFALLATLAAIVAVFIWIKNGQIYSSELENISELIKVLSITSQTTIVWLPSSWFAAVYSDLLENPSYQISHYLFLILGITGLTSSAFYILIKYGYENVYVKANSFNKNYSTKQYFLSPIISCIEPILPSLNRAFIFKETRLFLRDITQSVQLILLLTLCLIYLYNFQRFDSLFLMSLPNQVAWYTIVSPMNICLGTFVLITISARFAFPSISIESKTWWILQTSPLSIRSILQQKVNFFFFLFLLPVIIIFISGAFALQLPAELIAIHAIIGISMSYLYFAEGLKFGARYVNFNWENQAQLTSSLGNFHFMINGIGLGLLLLIPVVVLTFIYSLASLKLIGNSHLLYLAFLLSFIVFIISLVRAGNVSLTRAAIELSKAKLYNT